jgi:hypothetical protein
MSVHRPLSGAKRTVKTTCGSRVIAKLPLTPMANPASCAMGMLRLRQDIAAGHEFEHMGDPDGRATLCFHGSAS